MDKQKITERLTEVFRDVFDDDGLEITDETTADDIEDWDSLEHISLISAVEKAFKMRFTMKEVSGMKNVGEMISILCERATKC
ncbi:MAG: acyl carrier protein [Oscillospiraceae bacterium]|nr:acyl carrier protein [Oscillospiraceae bacterium]